MGNCNSWSWCDHETADNELTTPTPTVASLQEIDVEIEYDKNEIEFTYEIKSNGTIEATYEDESADLELEGKAAQDKIMTLLDGLSIKTATNEQIKEHITKKLAVNEQVKQFEFEANFTDKTEIEFVLK